MQTLRKLLKKIPKLLLILLLSVLTIGASITLGLLSFSGMFLLWPIFGLAAASFVLAVAYEGEIYWQNLKGAVLSLFTPSGLKKQLFREFLFEHIRPLTEEEKEDEGTEAKHACHGHDHEHEERTEKLPAAPKGTAAETRLLDYQTFISKLTELEKLQTVKLTQLQEEKGVPALVTDYIQMVYRLKMIDELKHHWDLPKEALKYQKLLQKKMLRFELDLSEELLKIDASARKRDTQKLQGAEKAKAEFINWAREKMKGSNTVKATYYRRYGLFTAAKVFSLMAGGFMFVGTAFLLFDAFISIPFFEIIPFTAMPMLIMTLAAAAGAAYALITYYSVVSMINNRFAQKFVSTYWADLKRDWKNRSVLKIIWRAVAAIILFGLVVAFTICTMGTWWSIGQNLAFLIEEDWLLTGTAFLTLSTLSINLFNSLCTWFEFRAKRIETFFQETWKAYYDSWGPIDPKHDGAALKSNPFRILLKILLLPLDLLLFIAHIITIGVTGDQIKGLDPFVSAAFGTVQEGIEDSHRLFFDDHHHGTASISKLLENHSEPGSGHEHALNLPRLFIKLVFAPIVIFAVMWDWYNLAKTEEHTWRSAFTEACTRQLNLKRALPEPLQVDCQAIEFNPLTQDYDNGLMTRPLVCRLYADPLPVINPDLARAKRTVISDVRKDRNRYAEVLKTDSKESTIIDASRHLFWETKLEPTYTRRKLEKAHQALMFTDRDYLSQKVG